MAAAACGSTCVSSFTSSRLCGATAATCVVAFVMLAAFAFGHSATACGHSDPAGGSCFQCVAATLAALLVASFVFVPLCAVLLEFAGILNLNGCDASEMLYLLEGMCVFAGVYWCVDDDFAIFCRVRQLHVVCCIKQQPLCVCRVLLLFRGHLVLARWYLRLRLCCLVFSGCLLCLLSRQQLQRWCPKQQHHCACG